MNLGNKLSLNRKSRTPFGIKGERMDYSVPVANLPAVIPSSYRKISVKFPKGVEGMKIVPESPKLVFNFHITGDSDSWPVNNLSANLVKDRELKWGSIEVEKNVNFYVYQTYKDLWLTEQQRLNSVTSGIQSINLCKLRSGAKSANEQESPNEVIINRVYGNKYEIPLNFSFLSDHHPFYPYIYPEDIQIDITLNSPELVINSTDSTAKPDYTLSNIRLEYSTVFEPQLANQIVQLSDSVLGITYFYDYISFIGMNPIKQSDLSFKISIQDKRRSVRGILLLFTLPPEKANRNSEKFFNPQIENVDISINGTTHKIYADGYKEDKMYREAKKFFMSESRKLDELSYVSAYRFYDTDFCLWLDTRSTEDNNLHGNGLKIEDGFNIDLMCTKKDTGSGHVNVYTYLIADALFTLLNRRATNPVF